MLMDTNGHTILSEDYVSFEVAKLLKEKGFDGDSGDCECHMFYCEYTEERIMPICEIGFIPDNETVFFAPTHQMAMKWLREVHNLSVETFSIKGTSNVCPVFWKGNVVKLLTQDRAFSSELVGSYEQAVEAALKYALENLI